MKLLALNINTSHRLVYSLPTCVEVQKTWIYIYTPPYAFLVYSSVGEAHERLYFYLCSFNFISVFICYNLKRRECCFFTYVRSMSRNQTSL
jgi:hypothetical protein